MHVLWHVKHAVEATEQLWMRERCHWLLVGGTVEALAESGVICRKRCTNAWLGSRRLAEG
jgi:hypothetical protein